MQNSETILKIRITKFERYSHDDRLEGQTGHLGRYVHADIVAALYGHASGTIPNPNEERDRFIYSSHAAIAQYAALAETDISVEGQKTIRVCSRLRGIPTC